MSQFVWWVPPAIQRHLKWAERKYTGTDAELLRMQREGLSLRAIAAEVGIGKSVVGARIGRAEAAERRRAESTASTQANDEDLGEAAAAQPLAARDQTLPDRLMSARSSSRGASATTSPDPHASGPINVRAELEAIAQDAKAGYRERLGALQTLAKMDEAAKRPPSEEIRPRRIGTLAAEPQRREDGTITYRLWMREPPGWASPIDGLTPRKAWALLGVILLRDELGDDFVRELRAGLPADEDEEPEPGDDEEPES